MKREIYEHSDGVGALAPIVVLLGAMVAVAMAWAYARLATYAFMCIAPFVFLILVNIWIGKVVYLAKCRNRRLGAVIGFVIAFIFLYAAWAFMSDASARAANRTGLVSHTTLDAFAPQFVWECAQSAYRVGWAFRWPAAANGWWLLALWLLEAVAFLYIGIRWGVACASNRPFCVRSNNWMKKISPFGLYKWPRDEALVKDMLAGDVARVLELKHFPDDEVESDYCEEVKVDVWACPRPENGGVFEVYANGYFGVEPPKERDEKFTTKPFTGESQKIWISAAEVELLREFFGKSKRKGNAEIPLAKPVNDQSTKDGFDSSLR